MSVNNTITFSVVTDTLLPSPSPQTVTASGASRTVLLRSPEAEHRGSPPMRSAVRVTWAR